MATNAAGAITGPVAEAPKLPQAGGKDQALPRAGKKSGAAGSAPAARRLPSTGRLAAGRLQILIGLVIVFLTVGAACVYLNAREASQNATYLAAATEMQMLSQRIANSAQQAVQGTSTAFGQLAKSHDEFVANLDLLTKGGTKLGVTVQGSPDAVQPKLQAFTKQWDPVQKNIALVRKQEKNLIDLRQREETIAKTAPQL